MSMDYPDYLRIRERSRWLGIVWRIGDTGYYLFLLSAILVPIVLIATSSDITGNGALRLGAFVACCAVGFGVCVQLKYYAHVKGGTFDDQGVAEPKPCTGRAEDARQ
jgi:hypothetical protein